MLPTFIALNRTHMGTGKQDPTGQKSCAIDCTANTTLKSPISFSMTTPVLMIAPQYTFFPTPRKTVTSNAYYLALASLPNHYGAALSNPSNTIEIFDKSTLERMATLVGHENGAVTALKVAENMNGFGSKHFVSSGKDGSVKIWDDRTGSHAIKSGLPSLVGKSVILTAQEC